MSAATTLGYAFTLGLVAALNPCGFPLLPAYLALFVDDGNESTGPGGRTGRGLLAGACVSGGFVLVFGLIGVAVSFGLQLMTGWIGWLMLGLGAGMVGIGIRGLAGASLRIPVPPIRFPAGRTAVAMGGFGVAYAVASLSCALPLFLAAVSASAANGPLAGTAGFIAYAVGMGLFITAASLVAAHLGAETVRRLRPATRLVPRCASVLVILVGLYLGYYWSVQLINPLATNPLTTVLDSMQSTLSDWISTAPFVIAGILCCLVASAAIWIVWNKSRTLATRALTRKEPPDAPHASASH